MSFNLDIVWPLDCAPPPYEEGIKLFDKLAVEAETKSMVRWFTECLMCVDRAIVAMLDIKPYSFAHKYEVIEEDGEFPKELDAWVSPDEMVEATRKLLSLIGNKDPDASYLVASSGDTILN